MLFALSTAFHGFPQISKSALGEASSSVMCNLNEPEIELSASLMEWSQTSKNHIASQSIESLSLPLLLSLPLSQSFSLSLSISISNSLSLTSLHSDRLEIPQLAVWSD